MTNRFLLIKLLKMFPDKTVEELHQLAFYSDAIPSHGVREHRLGPVLELLRREGRVEEVNRRWRLKV